MCRISSRVWMRCVDGGTKHPEEKTMGRNHPAASVWEWGMPVQVKSHIANMNQRVK
jgi:hypothetical protein